jgi:hypothetical protein
LAQQHLRWLMDIKLPQVPTNGLDAVYAEELLHRPGPVGLSTSISLDRILVTNDQEFRGPWELPLMHPGLVVLDGVPADGHELERNLMHLEFRLGQDERHASLAGVRFLLRLDKGICQIMEDGTEVAFEPWKQVYVQSTPGCVFTITPRMITQTAPA